MENETARALNGGGARAAGGGARAAGQGVRSVRDPGGGGPGRTRRGNRAARDAAGAQRAAAASVTSVVPRRRGPTVRNPEPDSRRPQRTPLPPRVSIRRNRKKRLKRVKDGK